MRPEELDRLHQQIVEVHGAGLQQPRLVVDVDVGVLALEDVGGALDRLLGGDQLVLPQADLRVRGARWEALGIEVEIAHDVAGEPLRIGLVVDAEGARVTEPVAVGAQDADARRVERAHPHRPGDRTHQVGHTVTHLLRGLVGERDRQDRRGRHSFVDEVGDAMREHTRLARAGTGDDQQRAATVHDSVELIGIEQVEIERGTLAGDTLGRQIHGVPILRKGCHVGVTACSRKWRRAQLNRGWRGPTGRTRRGFRRSGGRSWSRSRCRG